MGGEGRVGVGVGVGVPMSPRPLRGGNPATTLGGRFGNSGIWNMAAGKENGGLLVGRKREAASLEKKWVEV